MSTVIHIAPHPDDELLGAPGTLLRLKDAGWRVVNLAISLGREEQQARRRQELTTACERAEFDLRICEPAINISRDCDWESSQRSIQDAVTQIVLETEASLLVAPHEYDGHHGHEITGLAVLAAASEIPGLRLWQWGLWADLRAPNLFVPLSDQDMIRAQWAVSAHQGEVERNDYVSMLDLKSRLHAILGTERVLGWGSEITHRRAELLCEMTATTERTMVRTRQPRIVGELELAAA